MRYDLNKLEQAATALKNLGRNRDDLRYSWRTATPCWMEVISLGGRIAECYERLGKLDAARHWYGRTVEENPAIRLGEQAAYERLGSICISNGLRISGGGNSFGASPASP